VIETDSVDALAEADLAVIVNPNNPDGRTVERSRLLDLAAILRRKGGLLVVDEAFMDVGARGASLAADAAEEGIVVLKSFGKFFGLAGVRLGFAIASAATARRLDDLLGPWAVSGPALEYGLKGLADTGWQQAMRERLAQEAAMLDALLLRHGIAVSGGTPLFRFVEHQQAGDLFHTLGEHGILVRRFDRLANCLRFGLPAGEAEMARLDQALTGWSKMRDVGR
jgi:cobalamin biosynthetic protein CobC